MPLTVDNIVKAFDKESIANGNFISAQYRTWPEPRNGLVAAVSDDKLTIIFLPGFGNVSNYYTIRVAEVADGSWNVRWSPDLETIEEDGSET